MFIASRRLISSRVRLTFILLAAFIFSTTASITSLGQRQRTSDEPLFSEYKGVRIGMPAEEARKKLGSPSNKADDQDLYLNDTQTVQVYYDKRKAVSAISIDFMSGATGIPAAKDVVGTEPDKKADGSAYKMMRYPKLGYWVSYSRTAGSSPTITITIQKIEQ
ncbi:MAG TPA: hypothetical protein VLN44_12440 [Pyrinomonadaceae bacterium]|nr:hypothetical protein [Pyrinomonadaceae bacterium]